MLNAMGKNYINPATSNIEIWGRGARSEFGNLNVVIGTQVSFVPPY
jgi:hypothetical protein